MPINLVWLNMNRRDTRQQPVQAYRPANRANKKLHPKGYIMVCTQFSNVCTFHKMYIAICALNVSYTALNIQVCALYIHVCMIQNAYIKLDKSINMYIHV